MAVKSRRRRADPPDLDFPERLRAAMDAHGHVQEQAGEVMHVAQHTVSGWLRGKAEPRGLLQRDAVESYIASAPAGTTNA